MEQGECVANKLTNEYSKEGKNFFTYVKPSSGGPKKYSKGTHAHLSLQRAHRGKREMKRQQKTTDGDEEFTFPRYVGTTGCKKEKEL